MGYTRSPMGSRGEGGRSGREKAAIFLPLLLYLGYVWHLVSQSSRPFLLRWLEGCFGLFLALVFCNILRRAVTPEGDGDGEDP